MNKIYPTNCWLHYYGTGVYWRLSGMLSPHQRLCNYWWR